jgi:hypothetical protein
MGGPRNGATDPTQDFSVRASGLGVGRKGAIFTNFLGRFWGVDDRAILSDLREPRPFRPKPASPSEKM